MGIHRIKSFLYIILLAWGLPAECTCCLTEQYFNENILSYPFSFFDTGTAANQPVLYQYEINTESCASNLLSIEVEYKIFSPEIGISSYETFYTGNIILNDAIPLKYFTNNEIQSASGPSIKGNAKLESLISYVSQSGKMPNGKYLIHFTLISSDDPIFIVPPKIIEVQSPVTLELLSPGGTLSELSNAYTFSTVPLFTWFSDYCPSCEYAIRVCEYNQNEHESLEDALVEWSLVPMDQSQNYHSLGWNAHSFQYPSIGNVDLEVGKYYLWQVRRSFSTALDVNHDYSGINVFEVRSPDKLQLDYSDPYLAVIESIIGTAQFYLLFSPGGDLERFTTDGDAIWINDDEINIEALHSILSEIKAGNATLESVRIK